MQNHALEQELAHHCAPALLGLKPANLVSFSKQDFPELEALLEEYRRTWIRFGICLEIVCSCDRRNLVLVYQLGLLRHQLMQKQVRELLIKAGYPDGGMQQQLAHLKIRLAVQKDFPHEIGLFLGYPVADVLAFQTRHGEGCKLCGYWKVYENVEAAKQCFARFDVCRAALTNALRTGNTLTQMLTFAQTA